MILLVFLSIQFKATLFDTRLSFETVNHSTTINNDFHYNMYSNYQYININSSTLLSFSNNQTLVFYFTSNVTSNISIYSISLFDTSVKVYEIGDMTRIPPRLILTDNNSGYNQNFRIDMTIYANKIYMLEVQLHTTVLDTASVRLSITESPFCWGNELNYTLGYSSVTNNYIFYNYSSKYNYQIEFAVSIWNSLEKIQFVALPDHSPFIEIDIEDFFSSNTGPAYYQKRFDSRDYIKLNTFYLDSWSDDEIIKTVLHELGHSLGISMDNFILSEDEVNVMIQGKRNLTNLGPCDILVYQNLYGE